MCAVTLFREGRRDTITVVITELSGNPLESAEDHFAAVARKVCSLYLRDANAQQVAWVYRLPDGCADKERLYQVRLGESTDDPSFEAITPKELSALVNRGSGFVRQIFFPEFRTVSSEAGRRRPKKENHCGVPV
jgi:hypothetical protein